ncbi:hypothetical protein ACM61V_19320 [Sphingomonas sp. TX0543]|uniref:hypothetical protein n=1 Tax=Sphingomonas sp. TX0543 TaxID=3399682 RepID=UPI003AFA3334
MACFGVAIGHDGLDPGPGLAQQPEGARAKEALAILRDTVEQDQPGEHGATGGVGEPGVASDDGSGRGHGEDGDAFEPRAAPEEADGDLRCGISGKIVMLGDKGARQAVIDDVGAIGSGIDEAEIGGPEGAPFPPALAARGVHAGLGDEGVSGVLRPPTCHPDPFPSSFL